MTFDTASSNDIVVERRENMAERGMRNQVRLGKRYVGKRYLGKSYAYELPRNDTWICMERSNVIHNSF